MHIQDIRNRALFEEVDYLFLKDTLKDYAQPRNKIQQLLKSKGLIRVKKGLYVFGPTAARSPYCKEVLANLIYGPSAISLEYALSFYGLIPERVEEITSITNKRNKSFTTPVGRFTYHYLHPHKYPIGITQIELHNRKVLMATPEKALCDLLILRGPTFENTQMLQSHLVDNLRLEEDRIHQLDLMLLTSIAKRYSHPNINLLLTFLRGENAKNG